jgi:hypothetical protein
MKATETYKWLMENGGPVIRYRTATELMMPDKAPSMKALDIQALRNDLLQNPLVRTWLDNFKPPFLLCRDMDTQGEFTHASTEIHGAKDTALENMLGNLTDLGLQKGMPELDKRVAPYLEWLNTSYDKRTQYFFLEWMTQLVANLMARAGYADEPVVKNLQKEHLDTVYQFTRKGDHNIYVDPDKYKKMPANFQKRPLINPELTSGQFKLPLIYDIVGWGAYLREAAEDKEQKKADTVIEYILNDDYQRFPWGYGVMMDG